MDKALNMSNREIDRLHVIRGILDGERSWREGAEMVRRSVRTVGRWCARVRQLGNRGIRHGLRGRPSNHQSDPELLGKALSALHLPKWLDFGPTFASEKLEEYCGIVLSAWTVRRLKRMTGLWTPRRHKPKHRSWRPRRACVGMLVQLDGSDHDWFEGRGRRCALLIFIDDATSRILYAEFIPVENTLDLLRAVRTYLRRFGRPVALYVDKDSIYKVNRQATVEEELQEESPLTQFTRAMKELGVEVIWANSPQAKGRVERGFGTHQDRLVKELRLRGISTIAAANRYLREEYVPRHNARFPVEPADPKDAHRPLLASHDLDAILSIHAERTVHNDKTVRDSNCFFQLEEAQPVRVYPRTSVSVQRRLDGSVHIVCKGRELKFHQLPGRPYRPPPPRRAKPGHARSSPPWTRLSVDPVYASFSLASREPTNPPASALRT